MLEYTARAVVEVPSLKMFKKSTWMWHLGTLFSGEQGGAGLKAVLDHRHPFQP